ncbi:zinc ribbon domain-containing protein [Myxococcaceae bacterium JPH2]|nr:zinc ribbon domain-containing protein [Myxococcaceae bacterium JPH2]
MPIYEYSCQSCGKTIDVLQKISDPTPEACTACGAAGSLSRVVSRSSFVLKGGGWYADLYGSTKKDGSSSSSSSSSSTSSSSTSTSSGGGDSGSSASSSAAPAAPAATSSTPKT